MKNRTNYSFHVRGCHADGPRTTSKTSACIESSVHESELTSRSSSLFHAFATHVAAVDLSALISNVEELQATKSHGRNRHGFRTGSRPTAGGEGPFGRFCPSGSYTPSSVHCFNTPTSFHRNLGRVRIEYLITCVLNFEMLGQVVDVLYDNTRNVFLVSNGVFPQGQGPDRILVVHTCLSTPYDHHRASIR